MEVREIVLQVEYTKDIVAVMQQVADCIDVFDQEIMEVSINRHTERPYYQVVLSFEYTL